MCPLEKNPIYTDLDEEIDYLHSYIEKQAVTEIKQPQKEVKHHGKSPESNLKTDIQYN